MIFILYTIIVINLFTFASQGSDKDKRKDAEKEEKSKKVIFNISFMIA